ncbi:helix-turn-helix domain-containing protein [Massilia haematophila]|uniref:Helix-turn-helix domain-containing protein n=1 Tax=Massilia haematophila TaxID=457923 RepID=A0ABV7PIF3_9BURK
MAWFDVRILPSRTHLGRGFSRWPQEDFSEVSSRTYLSSLERGMKAPTITKVDQIATVIGVHPLSLIAYAYLPSSQAERDQLWAAIAAEVTSFDSSTAPVAAGEAH